MILRSFSTISAPPYVSNIRRQTSLIRLTAIILCLGLLPIAAQAKETRTTIALFDGPGGPAYVQINGLTLNGKTELRSCDGVNKFDKHAYDALFKTPLAAASSLGRDSDGVLRLIVNSKPVCVVPSNLKFDRNAEFTPAEAADQAMVQGLVVSASAQGIGIPAFKAGVQLVFVTAPDAELAEYLLAQRAHSIQEWQTFLTQYGSSARLVDAKNSMAAIYEESAESAFAAYKKSTGSQI